jgi:hypothetical protein
MSLASQPPLFRAGVGGHISGLVGGFEVRDATLLDVSNMFRWLDELP